MLKLIQKDLKLFFTDKRAMMLTFLLPITLITLFAFAFGAVGNDKNKSKEYILPISDLDNSAASKAAIAELDTEKSIKVNLVPLADAQEAVKKGKADCVLIFYKGFSDSLDNGNTLPIELKYDEAQEVQVSMLQQALFKTMAMLPYNNPKNMQVRMNKQFDKMLGSNHKTDGIHFLFDTLYNAIAAGMSGNKPSSSNSVFSMASEVKMTKIIQAKTENSLGLIQAVAGTAIMMLLFSVAAIGASLLDEKQDGTLKRLLYSPISTNQILFGKMIYAMLIACIQLCIMFTYSYLVFGLDIMPHLPQLILMIFATAYACSSFGVVLASFAKSRQQIQGYSTLIVLVMSCIGGSMIPLFIMPDIMQKIALVTVNYWGIQGFYDILWRMLPITDITFLSRIIVLLIIGTVLNLLALRMFRKNVLSIA